MKKIIGFLAALLITPVIGRATEAPVVGVYTDVKETHWAYDYINDAASKGWFESGSITEFRPEDEITRSEVAKLMAVATGNTRNLYYPREDVQGHWAEKYINSVSYMFVEPSGLTIESEFRPYDTITREEVILALVIGNKHVAETFNVTEDSLELFTDLETINQASEDFVKVAVELGLITGKLQSDGTYEIAGDAGLSRAEFATLLVRASEIGQGEGYELPTEPDFDVSYVLDYNKQVISVNGKFEVMPSPYSHTLVGNVQVIIEEDGSFNMPKVVESFPYILTVQTYDIYGYINYTEVLIEEPAEWQDVEEPRIYEYVEFDLEDSKYSQTEVGVQFANEVLELVNEIRVGYGLSKLELSEDLTKTAMLKSYDMMEQNYFGHLDDNNFNIAEYYGVGENIGMTWATPQDVVDAWMSSQGHKANILNANYTELGVGYIVKPSDSRYNYWTQHFK